MKNLSQTIALAATLAALTPAAHADLVFAAQDIAGPTFVQRFDVVDAALMDTAQPRMQIGTSLGLDIGVRAQDGQLQIGSNSGVWSLGDNGEWTDTTDPLTATDSTFLALDGVVDYDAGTFATLSFDFGGRTVQGVGAFMSYDPAFSHLGTPIQLYLAAYDLAGNLIEEHTVPFAAVIDSDGLVMPNQGVFYGIQTPAAQIARFDISAPYAVVDNLTVTSPVPEPATWALVLTGLLATAGLRRARR